MPKILELITEPDPILHKKSSFVDNVDDKIRDLMDNMLVTMHHNEGIGLAAVQVGILKNVIVIDVDESNASGIQMPLFMANAEIIEYSKNKTDFKEGCLSLPGFRAEVTRPESIVVKFLDYNNTPQQITVEHSILSVCIQHEIDHTNGILFIDYISKLKKDIAMKKMIKRKKMIDS